MELNQECIRKVKGMVVSLRTGAAAEAAFMDDLVGEGLVGVAEAHQRFMQEQEASFWSYAYWRVRGRILDCLRKDTRLRRARVPWVTVDEPADAEIAADVHATAPRGAAGPKPSAGAQLPLGGRTIESQLTARSVAALIAECLEELPPTHRRLAIECGMMRRPVLQVARGMGLDRRRASRLLEAALRRMRKKLTLQGYSLEDFV